MLYHYTSAESLLGIIKSGEIWLSDSLCSNDSEESFWADKFVFNYINSSNDFNDEEKHYIWENYKSNCLKHYIFCLSSKRDLLSQWRGYADDGKGVAIGFQIDQLPTNRHLPVCHTSLEVQTTLLPVTYTEEQQKSQIEQMIKVATEELIADQQEALRRGLVDDANKEIHPITRACTIGSSLSRLRSIFKNNSFSEECETRIIHTPFLLRIPARNNKFDPILLNQGLKYDTRISNGNTVLYFKMPINKTLIGEIILGPKSKINPQDLKDVLELLGYPDIHLDQSASSYR